MSLLEILKSGREVGQMKELCDFLKLVRLQLKEKPPEKNVFVDLYHDYKSFCETQKIPPMTVNVFEKIWYFYGMPNKNNYLDAKNKNVRGKRIDEKLLEIMIKDAEAFIYTSGTTMIRVNDQVYGLTLILRPVENDLNKALRSTRRIDKKINKK